MCYTSKAIGPKAHNKTQYTLTQIILTEFLNLHTGHNNQIKLKEFCDRVILKFLLMYIMLWALGPIALLVQYTYTCTTFYLYRTLMSPI